MSPHRCNDGCHEYSLISRRSFLGWSAGAMAAVAVPAWLPRLAFAASENSSRDILVSSWR